MKIAFDIELMRPACVIVAAGMGADPHLADRFETRHWLLHPTPGMHVYEVTETQLQQLVRKVEDRAKRGN